MTTLSERLARPISPTQFARQRSSHHGPVVVCAGDSITHGMISSNYVARLDHRFRPQGFCLVNAGISGDLAWNLLQRIDAVIACRPDVVTILIGTNDVAAQIDASWREGYMKQQHLPENPTLDWYRENLRAIIERLLNETNARVSLIEIPVLGEDLESRYNALVNTFNVALHGLAAEYALPVLPLHSLMVDHILKSGGLSAFDGTKTLMGKALVSHFLRRRSWNGVSASTGRTLLTDDIHLNDRGASLIVALIEEYLVDQSRQQP